MRLGSLAASLCLLGAPTQAFVVRSSSLNTASLTRTQPLNALEPFFLSDTACTLLTALDDAPPEAGGISYSKASYYTILGLYLLSFPGLLSTVKRSTAAKVKRKTFVSPGEKVENGMSLRQQAGEIMACKWDGCIVHSLAKFEKASLTFSIVVFKI